MEAVIFCGIQGAGKTEFYKARFFHTHLRINLDMLRTRHREAILLQACLEAGQRFVVDNTNPTREDRARYIGPAREAHFDVVGYWFDVEPDEAWARNLQRPEARQVPQVAVYATAAKIEPPSYDEGFDRILTVGIRPDGSYQIDPLPEPD